MRTVGATDAAGLAALSEVAGGIGLGGAGLAVVGHWVGGLLVANHARGEGPR